MAKVSIGSISAGTLRTEDLLEAFASELDSLRGTSRSHYQLVFDAQNRYYLDDGRDEREEEAGELVSELMDALNEYCPPFVFFGALEGDGSDFGYWPDVDALEQAVCDATGVRSMADDEYVLADDGVIVQVSDHGNIVVMDLDRRELWSCV
jgi:hypothetical protein